MFTKKKDIPKQEETSTISTRKRLYKSLSQSEKSLRRSTIGPLSSTSNSPAPTIKTLDIESPFLKVVRDGQNTDQQNEQSGKRKVNLTADEKKSRRKSLLAPMQSLFNVTLLKDKKDGKHFKSLDSIHENQSKKKLKFFKKEKKDALHKDSNESKNDPEERLKKERKKKLQKELDKIEKEKEKAHQSTILLSLNQVLKVGDNNIKLPSPIMKTITMQPMRPPPVFKA